MDLDRFKDVNDTFGHEHGDALLKEAALRLGGALRAQDTLCRLGGDEFAVLVPEADGPAAVAVADRLTRALREPFLLEGHPIEAAASIGIVVCPQHADDVDTILRHADVAMYQASAPTRTARSTTRTRTTTAPRAWRWSATCAGRSRAASSSSTSSPSSSSRPGACSAPRPSCAGTTPRGACSVPTSSSTSPSRPASSAT